jgi:hypothetical protein
MVRSLGYTCTMPHWRSCFGSYPFKDVDKLTVELLFDPTYQGRGHSSCRSCNRELHLWHMPSNFSKSDKPRQR